MQYKTPKIYAAVKYNKDRKHRSAYSSINSRVMVKPLIAMVVLLMVCSGFGIYFVQYSKKRAEPAKPIDTNSQQGTNVPLKPLDTRIESWWNNEFRFYQKFSVRNLSIENSLPSDQVAILNFNHAEMVRNGKSTPDGKDLKVVYLTKDNKYQSLNFQLHNANSENAELRFSLFSPIGVKESDEYFYLYYGNILRTEGFTLSSVAQSIDRALYQTSLGVETRHPLDLDINRKWIIRGESTVVDEPFKRSAVSLASVPNKVITAATINVLDVNNRLVYATPMVQNLDQSYATVLTLEGVPLGDYTVQVNAIVDGVEERSPKQKIHLSAPLYVNWSMDWEGDELQDRWMQLVESVAAEFRVPITHYFNPRIYDGATNADRAKYYTNWVLNRQRNNGDEIALHLHMWFDMVKAVGLEVKNTPFWEHGTTGHDVPQTAYTVEEFEKMVQWALQKFNENGLPKPILYRAGGWQINAEQLKVLIKYGFKVDSSGRNYVKFGRKQYPVPWNLNATTKPFKPSESNINATGRDALNIWEFPNNGDNTSNYGAASTKVIDNFNKNFNGDALRDKQTFVILSHIQYFSNDEPVIRRTLAEISKYTAALDNGPVIYTTIKDILPEYEAGM